MSEPAFSTIRAVILAAGLSSRMGGKPKALFPLGGTSMLGRAVSAFLQAGITGVRVITGHEAERVAEEAVRLGATPVFNPDYEQGMFPSICAGLKAVCREREESAGIDAVFLLPVDAALIQPESVISIARAWSSLDMPARRKSVFIPSFGGRCGHPPLFGSDHFLPMMLWRDGGQCQEQRQSRGGLRDYLSALMESAVERRFRAGRPPERRSLALPARDPVLHDCSVDQPSEGTPESAVFFLSLPDAGIASDMDTPEALAEASAFLVLTGERRAPAPEEAWEWVLHSGLHTEKIRHSILVALGALRLGLSLEKTGAPIDTNLHVNGGLLHDVARMHKAHARVGAAMTREQGWHDCSVIVDAHTVLPDAMLRALGLKLEDIPVGGQRDAPGARETDGESFRPEVLHAAASVYLSDKFFYRDTHVSLARRFGVVKEHFAGNVERIRGVSHREMIAHAVRDHFLRMTGQKPEETVLRPHGHALEAWLTELLDKSRAGAAP